MATATTNTYYGWEKSESITASDAANFDSFGRSLACSEAGLVVVVGARGKDGAGTNRGKVYVYSGSNWTTETGLTASDAADNDEFGCSVACSADGSVVVIGAFGEDGSGGSDRGKVYVYSGSNWGTETQLTASDAANFDYFGSSVACSADGSVVVVGAPYEYGAGTNRGKVYVYSGTTWGTETQLTASDAADNDQFGRTVTCSSDGSVIAVGAPYEDGAGTNRGKIYIYSGTTWGTETTKTASDAADNDEFGTSVDCSADGSVVVVGAPGEDGAGTNRGKVYIYSGTSWSIERTRTANIPENNNYFGRSVACSSNGLTVVVGAPGSINTAAGKAYTYSGPDFGAELSRSGVMNDYNLGESVVCASEGSLLVAGAPWADGAGTDRGIVYIYSNPLWTTTAGGTPIEWYTPQLQAATLSGIVSARLSLVESNAAADATARLQVAVVDNDGSGAVVYGSACPNVELGTSEGAVTVEVAGPPTSIATGQRLRFRVLLDDYEGPLVTGHTATLYYSGAVAGTAADSYVVLPVPLYELEGGALVSRSVFRLQAVHRAATF